MAWLAGCSSTPPRIAAPDWSPTEVADSVLGTLDQNADEQIDRAEAAAAPGLVAGFSRMDANADQQLTRDEIEQRIALYQKMKTGLISRSFTIVVNGRPAAGARVEFVPESFASGIMQKATGVTDRAGVVSPQTVGQSFPAMQTGFYRVHLFASETATEPLEPKKSVGVEVSPVAEEDDAQSSILRFEK